MFSPIGQLLIALCAVLCTVGAMAQPDALARDFEKLSAKERARIAKEEQASSLKDAPYQAVMAEAELLFQRSQYEASLAKFQEARVLRPYNVYPKVKIQDLQALIAERDAEQAVKKAEQPSEPMPPAVQQQTPTQKDPEQLPSPPTPGPVPAAERLVIADPPKPATSPVLPGTVQPVLAPAVKAEPSMHKTTPVQYTPKVEAPPKGMLEQGERVFKEGRSVVVERTVPEDNRLVVYRKVSHPWGEVNCFRDGVAISDRQFDQASVGR